MNTLRFRILTLIVAASLLNGCAFVDMQVPLPDSSAALERPLDWASLGQGAKVCSSFSDMRPKQSTIGPVRNLFGMKTASVRPASSIPDWVKSTFERELETGGFMVARTPCPDDTSLLMEVSLTDVSGDSYFLVGTEVKMEIQVRDKESQLINRVFVGRGAASDWATALSQSMGSVVSNFRDELFQELQ